MPYSRKISNAYIPILIALSFAPFFFVHAEPAEISRADTIQSELGRLTESLNLLSAMKTSKRSADATALQTALNNVLRLSDEEVRTISIRLTAQKNLTEAEDAMRADIINDLAALKLYLQAARTNTTQEAGPTAIAWTAQKFKEWREGSYTQTMQRAASFIGIFENEASIQSANARLNAILKDEKKIRALLPIPKTSTFMRLVKKTQTSLRKAAELNAEAHTLLTLDSDKTEGETTIDTLIAESNEIIETAYDDFIAMSKLIKK